MDCAEIDEVQAAFANDVAQIAASCRSKHACRALNLLSDTILSYADDAGSFAAHVLEDAGNHFLQLLQDLCKSCNFMQQQDHQAMRSISWPNIHQSLQVLTSISHGLSQKMNQFWCEQSQHLYQQASPAEHAKQLAQLGAILPVLLDVLTGVQSCEDPPLQALTFGESAAIQLQLLITCQEPSQTAESMLNSALQPLPDGSSVTFVWQATVAAIQVHANLLMSSDNTADHDKQSCQTIFQFLWSWRSPNTGSIRDGNKWDACLVAIVNLLATTLDNQGPDCLTQPAVLALCHVLACSHTASLWLRAMLAHPRASGTKGAKKAFDAYSTCFQHCPSALLSGCCSLLRPESNQPAAVRMQGLLTVDRAVDTFLLDSSDSDHAQLQLWSEEAVQLLLFTCAKDPSVRIRRAAMSLLTSVVSRQQSVQESDIVHTLLLKCRDKDSKVQRQAYGMMVQLPTATLTAHLRIEDWRAVLNTALLSKRAADLDIASEAEHQEVVTAGTHLLHKYLETEQILSQLQNDAVAFVTAPDNACVPVAILSAVQHASQSLQALQLPWHNSAVCQAYSTALQGHAH